MDSYKLIRRIGIIFSLFAVLMDWLLFNKSSSGGNNEVTIVSLLSSTVFWFFGIGLIVRSKLVYLLFKRMLRFTSDIPTNFYSKYILRHIEENYVDRLVDNDNFGKKIKQLFNNNRK
jgi:hypothetical protein